MALQDQFQLTMLRRSTVTWPVLVAFGAAVAGPAYYLSAPAIDANAGYQIAAGCAIAALGLLGMLYRTGTTIDGRSRQVIAWRGLLGLRRPSKVYAFAMLREFVLYDQQISNNDNAGRVTTFTIAATFKGGLEKLELASVPTYQEATRLARQAAALAGVDVADRVYCDEFDDSKPLVINLNALLRRRDGVVQTPMRPLPESANQAEITELPDVPGGSQIAIAGHRPRVWAALTGVVLAMFYLFIGSQVVGFMTFLLWMVLKILAVPGSVQALVCLSILGYFLVWPAVRFIALAIRADTAPDATLIVTQQGIQYVQEGIFIAADDLAGVYVLARGLGVQSFTPDFNGTPQERAKMFVFSLILKTKHTAMPVAFGAGLQEDELIEIRRHILRTLQGSATTMQAAARR